MEIKFNCSNPACRQHILVDKSNAGELIRCPACGSELKVPDSAEIKFYCVGCGQHILVHVSEIGRFIRCPSCNQGQQIPGSPSKPVELAREGLKQLLSEQQPGLQTSQNIFQRICSSSYPHPWLRLSLGWSCGLVIFLCVIAGSYVKAWAAVPKKVYEVSREVYLKGDIRDAPVENSSGTLLMYAQDIKAGLGVFLVDLDSLQRFQIGTVNGTGQGEDRAFTAFGWSPDDAMLAYFSQRDQKNAEVVLCYGSTGAPKNSFDTAKTCGPVDKGVWVTTNSLVLLNHSRELYILNLQADPNLGEAGKQGFVKLKTLSIYDTSWIVPISDRAITIYDQGDLWTLDIPTRQAVRLTHLPHGILEWLDYSKTSGKYLFSLRPITQERDKMIKGKRHLYELDPGASEPVLVTDSQALNGRWTKNDEGISYVVSIGTTNYLEVQSADKNLETNLFRETGYVRSYNMAPGRDKLYAVAANDYKLTTIWEFDLETKKLRNVLPAQESYVRRKPVSPILASVKNKSGQKVDYYMVPPVELESGKRYPVVLDQFALNRYDENVQFLANAGIFYVSVHPFGMDAYTFASASSEETLAVYNELLKNPNVDPHRIYVSGHSASTREACQLATDFPELWRGVILETPVATLKIPAARKKFPSLFISIGDNDSPGLVRQANSLFQDACRLNVHARFNYQHSAHTYHSSQFRDEYISLAKFILTDY